MKPVSWTWAAYDFLKMKIPHICLWSHCLLLRPSAWDTNVTIAGYSFGRTSSYLPPKSLEIFLETDKPVLAIEFGSATISDSVKLMAEVFNAVGYIEAKAVVCVEKSKFSNIKLIPEHIFLVNEIRHEWLLPRVQGFVHHGGAGHTAAGLKSGIPMLIIPFSFDQNFWAAKVQQLQLGPPPLHPQDITAPKLAVSLKDLLSSKYQRRCKEMAFEISTEKDGAEVAAETIAYAQKSTDGASPCSIISGLNAHWQHVDSGLRLSGAAAACLTSHSILNWSDVYFVPGVNWSKEIMNGTSKLSKVLIRLTDVIYRFFGIISILLRFFVGPWHSDNNVTNDVEKDDYAIRMRDPVFQARIARAQYDLLFIKRELAKIEEVEGTGDGGGDDGDGGRQGITSVEDQIIQNWRVVSTAEFKSKFKKVKSNS